MEYQLLDETITKAMGYAEKQAGRTMSSKFEWSPSLQAGVSAVQYWKLCLRILKGASASASTLDHLHKLAFGSPYKPDILTQSYLSSQLTIAY